VCDRFLSVDPEARRAASDQEEQGPEGRSSGTVKENVSAQKYVDSPLKEALRRVPGWQTVARWASKGAKRLFKRWVQPPGSSRLGAGHAPVGRQASAK